jgi:putative addiction module CopG family antidote
MSITLSPEDQKKAEDLVASGRFPTVDDVVHAAIDALDEDADWQEYASDRISAGLEDIEAGRTVPLEEVLEMLRSARLQKA